MQERAYESTLNTWLAEALRGVGLDARPESGQGGGKRLDVEVRLDGIKVALEAEQGVSTNKKASAIKDADGRLLQELADCAIAICYPDGLASAADVRDCNFLHSLRTHKDRPPANKAEWKPAELGQLASFIRRIPDQLGDPDEVAASLSFSLDRAVSRLSEEQKQDLAAALDLPPGKPMKIEYGRVLTSRFNQAAKRAMLVIATAVMFHAQLDRQGKRITVLWDQRYTPPRAYEGEWPPPSARACVESDDPVGAFYAAWDMWLAVDYKPIFATARNALRGCAQDAAFTAAIRRTAQGALEVARNIAGLRHDLLGRIFHRVLETARYDGSFYTTTAAATLLATLAIREDMRDWSDPGAISRLRVTDPACGTGTLLMAAAERIRDLSSVARRDQVSRLLIENVLTGYDVNLTATHLAATTLGLLSPTTTFSEMKIYRALLGVEHGEAKLGSLEFLSPEQDKQPLLIPWPASIEQVESKRVAAEAENADLVIMNPPFTRDSLRHDQFNRAHEMKLKAREKELFDKLNGGIHRSHNGGGFLALADKIAKDENATIAVVLPLVGATNYATHEMRIYLAKKFHIDTIVTSHDPTRIYFSENTNIGEMLLICRRWPESVDKPATKIVNLYQNPATPAEAISVAQNIIEGKRIRGTAQFWPRERIAKGNWGGVQFFSPFLCEQFVDLSTGFLLPVRSLGQFAKIGPAGQGVRGVFDRSELPDAKGWRAFWFHRTQVTQTLRSKTDTYIVPKGGKKRQATDLWAKRGTLMVVTRARLNTVRCMSVILEQDALGSLWVPVRFDSDIKDDASRLARRTLYEKATCVYLNSTIGILAILGDRTNKIPSYPHFSMDDLNQVPVPDFNALGEAKVNALASVYDQLHKWILLPLPQMMEDETRKALDAIVVAALDLDPEIVATIRRELSREPSVTGKPYEV